MIVSLHTRSPHKAQRSAAALSDRLERYWDSIRLEVFHTRELGLSLVQEVEADRSSVSVSIAALNKWLKPRVNEDAVVHGPRHFMRDRLRAVECPSDIIDQIGGWSSSTVGSSYGKGYELPVLAKWMRMMER